MFARRRRQRCRAGHECADGARLADRGGEIGHRRDRAASQGAQPGKAGFRGVDRRQRSGGGSLRCRGDSELRHRIRRGRRLHASGAIPAIARAADGDAAQHAGGFCAGYASRAADHRRRIGREAHLARSGRNDHAVFGLRHRDHPGRAGAQSRGSGRGGQAASRRRQRRGPEDSVARHRPQIGSRRRPPRPHHRARRASGRGGHFESSARRQARCADRRRHGVSHDRAPEGARADRGPGRRSDLRSGHRLRPRRHRGRSDRRQGAGAAAARPGAGAQPHRPDQSVAHPQSLSQRAGRGRTSHRAPLGQAVATRRGFFRDPRDRSQSGAGRRDRRHRRRCPRRGGAGRAASRADRRRDSPSGLIRRNGSATWRCRTA